MAKRRQPADPSKRYSCPVSPERQERLAALHDRSAMRQWAIQTGVHDRVLELIVMQVRERQGFPSDKRTWRIVSGDDADEEIGG